MKGEKEGAEEEGGWEEEEGRMGGRRSRREEGRALAKYNEDFSAKMTRVTVSF